MHACRDAAKGRRYAPPMAARDTPWTGRHAFHLRDGKDPSFRAAIYPRHPSLREVTKKLMSDFSTILRFLVLTACYITRSLDSIVEDRKILSLSLFPTPFPLDRETVAAGGHIVCKTRVSVNERRLFSLREHMLIFMYSARVAVKGGQSRAKVSTVSKWQSRKSGTGEGEAMNNRNQSGRRPIQRSNCYYTRSCI